MINPIKFDLLLQNARIQAVIFGHCVRKDKVILELRSASGDALGYYHKDKKINKNNAVCIICWLRSMWGPLKTWLVGSIATQRVLWINGWDSKTAVSDGICVKPKSHVLLIYLSLAHLFMANFCSSFFIQVDSVCVTGWQVQTRDRLNQICLPFYTKLQPTSTTQLGLGLVCILPFSDNCDKRGDLGDGVLVESI